MNELKRELKALIIETLKLEEITPEGIDDEQPLFGEGLGLDSIDALELTVALERRYRLSIVDEQIGRRVFASISALASFVAEHRQDQAAAV
jgi:acyl carrier protein